MAFNPLLDGHKINMRSEFADTVTRRWTRAEVDNIMQMLVFDANSSALAAEAMTLDAVDAEWMGEMMVLDSAVITTNMRTLNGKFTESISRTLTRKLSPDLSISGSEVGNVKKSGLYASIAAIFHVTDGQTVTVIFHAPDGDPKVISPDDTLIAFRVLMNKTDITSHVLPQLISTKGVTSLDQASTNIASLLKANSETFKGKQAQIANQKKELEAKTAELLKLESAQVEAVQMEADAEKRMADADEKGAGLESRIQRVEEENTVLQEKIDKLKAKKVEVQPEPQPNKKPIPIESLVAIGGKKWESSDKSKSRVYFGTDFIAKAKEFKYTTYNTGNISSASLKGKSLSNSKAKSLLSSIASGKFWYDVNSGEFLSDGLQNSHAEIEAFIHESLKSINVTEKGQPNESQEIAIPKQKGDDELFIAQLVSDLEANGFILDNPNKRRPWLKEMGKGDWLLTILDKSGKYETIYGEKVNTSSIEVLNEATDDSVLIKFGVNSGDSMTAHDVAEKVINIVDPAQGVNAPTAPEIQPEPEAAPVPETTNEPESPEKTVSVKELREAIFRLTVVMGRIEASSIVGFAELKHNAESIQRFADELHPLVSSRAKPEDKADKEKILKLADEYLKEFDWSGEQYQQGQLEQAKKKEYKLQIGRELSSAGFSQSNASGERFGERGNAWIDVEDQTFYAAIDRDNSGTEVVRITAKNDDVFPKGKHFHDIAINGRDPKEIARDVRAFIDTPKTQPEAEAQELTTPADPYTDRIEALRTMPLKKYETAMDDLIAELEDAGKLAEYEAVLIEIDKSRDEDLKKLVEGV